MAYKKRSNTYKDDAVVEKALKRAGIHHSTEPVGEVSPYTFAKYIKLGKKANKKGWMVTAHSGKKYAKDGTKTYLTKDRKSGVAVTKDGDIVSVFSRAEGGGRMGKLIPFAIYKGGKKCDCYAGGLQNMYARYGAKATGRTKFDERYAPSDWDGSKHDVMAMIFPDFNTMLRSYNSDAKITTDKIKLFSDYFEMMEDRDRKLAKKTATGNNKG